MVSEKHKGGGDRGLFGKYTYLKKCSYGMTKSSSPGTTSDTNALLTGLILESNICIHIYKQCSKPKEKCKITHFLQSTLHNHICNTKLNVPRSVDRRGAAPMLLVHWSTLALIFVVHQHSKQQL